MVCITCDPMTERVNLPMKQGAIFQFRATVRRKNTGAAFDLTGFDPRGQVRNVFPAPTSIPLDVQVEDAPAGKLLITLGATKTSQVLEDSVFDVEIELLTNPDVVHRVVEGDILLSREVTR